jgi:hypothetical protein
MCARSFFKNATRASKQFTSSLCCACLHAYASLPTPLNIFHILRDALRRVRLNIEFFRDITTWRLRVYEFPQIRLLKFTQISRILQLPAASPRGMYLCSWSRQY